MLSVSRPEVDPRFIDRWAGRYIEIWKAQGEMNARTWAKSFLNEADVKDVLLKAMEMARQR